MTYDFAREGLPTQPGEASVRSFHSGGGPVPEHSDGWLHPAIARQELILSTAELSRLAVSGSNIVTVEPIEAYESGANFPGGIPFGD